MPTLPTDVCSAVFNSRPGAHLCRHLLSLLALVVLSSTPASTASRWIQVRTPNFLVIGDASERDVRQVAQRVERFREGLMQSLANGMVTSPVPTVIIVFASNESFEPFKPLFNGRSVEVGGYFLSGEAVNHITISVERGEAAYPVIFHEFTHAVINDTVPSVPLWLNEGLAEFYRTFELRDGGKGSFIGRAPDDRLRELRTQPLMPLEELMAIDAGSTAYNEGTRRGVFYAESWALTHYLLVGNPTRKPQLLTYLARMGEGAAPADAFRDAFACEPDQLERELRTYLRRFLFPTFQLAFDQPVASASVESAPLSEVDAQAYLSTLLLQLDRRDEARSRISTAMALVPDAPKALAVLGTLELTDMPGLSGFANLERAATLAPDDAAVQAALGVALVDRLEQQAQGLGADPDAVQHAREVLTRARRLEPRSAHVSSLLGYVELMAASDLPRARTLLVEAIRLAPTREHYRLLLAQVLLRERSFPQAQRILEPLLAHGTRPEVRDQARTLLSRLAHLQAAGRPPAADDTLAGSVPTDTPGDAPTAPARPAGASSPTTPASTTGGRFAPTLRGVRTGETRVSGRFEGVECTISRVVLRVRVERELLLLAAAAFDQVEFLSYRADAPKRVPCGPFPAPLRVLVTYRTATTGVAADMDGEAVAIELVPDDFDLR